MVKIHRIKGDITLKIANSFKGSISLDCEATGLKIPERDKLSLVQLCEKDGEVYIIQPDRNNYKAPNLVSLLENEKILKIGHFLRFDKSALEYFFKCKLRNIFCTKIASKIIRTYDSNHGLKDLVREFCNKSLDKRFNQLCEAIKRVYASTFYKEPKSLMDSVSKRYEEEKMAVIIKELIGKKHDEIFF